MILHTSRGRARRKVHWLEPVGMPRTKVSGTSPTRDRFGKLICVRKASSACLYSVVGRINCLLAASAFLTMKHT
jgi:hypothetical protein